MSLRTLRTMSESCWGKRLSGKDGTASFCSSGFVLGKRHFKSKFCRFHTHELWISSNRVRALTDELATVFTNTRCGGVWNAMILPKSGGEVRYRMINNTEGCFEPRLVVFQDVAPDFPWAPLPDDFVIEDGCLLLSVVRGTIVPALKEDHERPRVRAARLPPSSPPSSPSSSAPPSSSSPPMSPTPEPPTPSTVLIPSVLIRLRDSPIESEALTINCSRIERRMQKNRESAATSRERKRKYISELEQQVCDLEREVGVLNEENEFWKQLELPSEIADVIEEF